MKAANAPVKEKSRHYLHPQSTDRPAVARSLIAQLHDGCACAYINRHHLAGDELSCEEIMASFGLRNKGDRAFSADRELSRIYTELWKLDENRLKPGKHYRIDLQGGS